MGTKIRSHSAWRNAYSVMQVMNLLKLPNEVKGFLAKLEYCRQVTDGRRGDFQVARVHPISEIFDAILILTLDTVGGLV